MHLIIALLNYANSILNVLSSLLKGITQEQIDETRLTTEKQMLNDLREFARTGGDLEFKDYNGASMVCIKAKTFS